MTLPRLPSSWSPSPPERRSSDHSPRPSPAPWNLTGHGSWATPDTNPTPTEPLAQVPLVLPLSLAARCPGAHPWSPQGWGGGAAGASVPHIPHPSPVHSTLPSSVQGPKRHHSQPLALWAPSAKGWVGTLHVGQLSLLHPTPMSQSSPTGGWGGASPFVHTLCGCPACSHQPPCCSPSMPNGPCLGHRPNLCAGVPSSKHWKFSLLSPPLNFNFVVTECPCVPA